MIVPDSDNNLLQVMIVADSDRNLLGGYDQQIVTLICQEVMIVSDSDSNLLGGYDYTRY